MSFSLTPLSFFRPEILNLGEMKKSTLGGPAVWTIGENYLFYPSSLSYASALAKDTFWGANKRAVFFPKRGSINLVDLEKC